MDRIDDAATALAIEANGFSFCYPAGEGGAARSGGVAGAPAGIGPLDWRVPQGAFQLLVGATGSGKTTLLRCCVPAIAPSGERAGGLSVFGTAADALDARQAASLVGYVAQSPDTQIVCDTVWHEIAFGLENLGTPRDEMRRRVAEVSHFFGIEPWFRRPVADLSGGQRQLVALASVLALRPRALLLDEPTAQLDPVSEKNFLHALFRVNRELGVTVVVATHAPQACAEYATCAVELAGGGLEEAALSRFAARPLSLDGACAGAPSAPEAGCAGVPDRPAVAVRDAYVRYSRDDEWVLRGCDVEVRPGEVHALVGGNGCGKTTLLNLIAGVLEPARGGVRNALISRQALLPQDPKALLVCDTVDEELREWQRACGYSDDEVVRAARAFGLKERLAVHPFDLSGGQQQLLAFAKLLLTDPDLLLLDEPTKGLDAATKLALARAVRDCSRRGVTVVMATHDLTFAALVADRATMLFDGQAACTQDAADFFADNLFYRPVDDEFARVWRAAQAGEDARREHGRADDGAAGGERP